MSEHISTVDCRLKCHFGSRGFRCPVQGNSDSRGWIPRAAVVGTTLPGAGFPCPYQGKYETSNLRGLRDLLFKILIAHLIMKTRLDCGSLFVAEFNLRVPARFDETFKPSLFERPEFTWSTEYDNMRKKKIDVLATNFSASDLPSSFHEKTPCSC